MKHLDARERKRTTTRTVLLGISEFIIFGIIIFGIIIFNPQIRSVTYVESYLTGAINATLQVVCRLLQIHNDTRFSSSRLLHHHIRLILSSHSDSHLIFFISSHFSFFSFSHHLPALSSATAAFLDFVMTCVCVSMHVISLVCVHCIYMKQRGLGGALV